MKKILLSSITVGLLLVGCGDKKEDTTQKVTEVQEQGVQEEKTSLLDNAKQSITNTTNAVVEKTGSIVEETTNSIVDKTEDIIKKTEILTQDIKDEIEANVETITLKGEEAENSVNGAKLFASCVSCHGQKAEKKALGQSQIIAGWEKQKTIDALHGYKNDTYGGAMKGIMKGQVTSKSDEDIEALATYIETL